MIPGDRCMASLHSDGRLLSRVHPSAGHPCFRERKRRRTRTPPVRGDEFVATVVNNGRADDRGVEVPAASLPRNDAPPKANTPPSAALST